MAAVPTYRHTLGWLVAAALLAFNVPAIFSMGLGWQRSVFLLPYVTGAGVLLAVYFWNHAVTTRQWIAYWPNGLVATTVACFLLLRNIAGQLPSAVPQGAELLLTLIWVGLVYGAVDGLLLNVFPVLAVQGASFFESRPTLQSRLLRGSLALVASLAISVIYHLGYAEFRGAPIVPVMLGNAIITLTYLLSGNPLAAVATHVIMHMAAVLHGMETTLQLPPHYAGDNAAR
jgi:hypothetical protein